jgi:Spy/CpxP family protein refolding chaperone
MERGQVFDLLTPEQQKEVRERIRTRRAAEQAAKKPFPPK